MTEADSDKGGEATPVKNLEYFVNSVKEYSLRGMVPRDTKIGKLTVNARGTSEFSTWGTDEYLLWDTYRGSDESPAKKFIRLIVAAAHDDRKETSGLTRKTHYIALLEPPEQKYKSYPKDTVIFAYGFLIDPSGLDDRGLADGITGVLMNKEDAKALVGEIKKDPQLLEDFYQRVFAGLDSQKDTLTGMRRLMADGVVILDSEMLKEIPSIETIYKNAFPADLIKTFPRYNFKEPVGVKG